MSQIPNAAYNPTASPVSNSVSFAGSAPVPQQVQIGAGWGDLGAAFSAFSQTLAGVFTQVTKIDRQKAMEEGEQKMLANRTNYRKMVESGEIDPVENPWEALGAASADATMHADRWKAKVREEYQQRVMTDPGFATSVGAAEDFINERMKTELDSGLNNPVWQRTFMKDTSTFVTNMSITHADEVVKNRRKRAEEGLITGVLSDISDWKAVNGDTQTPLNEQMNTRSNEFYQTYGADMTRDTMVQTVLRARQESGDDPALLAELSKLKLGTGPLTSTAAYKAAELMASERLTAARTDRDSKELASFLSDAIINGKDVSPETINRQIAAIRPGIDKLEAAQVSAAATKVIEPMRTQVYQGTRNRLVFQYAQALSSAYTVDQRGMLPMDSGSVLARDPNQMKLELMRQINGVRGKLNLPLTEGFSEEEAKTLMSLAKAEASKGVLNGVLGLKNPDGTPDYETQALVTTNFAIRAKTDSPYMPILEGGIQTFRINPTPELAKANAAYGTSLVATYRAAASMGSNLKVLGFTEETALFAESLDSSLKAGSPIEQAMMNASYEVPRNAPLPTKMTEDDISAALLKKYSGTFKSATTASWQASQVQQAASNFMSQYKMRLLGKDLRTAELDRFITNRAMTTANGTIVIKPENTNSNTQIFAYEEPWNVLQRKYEETLKASDSTIKGVRFRELRGGAYYVEIYRADLNFTQIPNSGIEALNSAGLGASFDLDEAYDAFLKLKTKEADDAYNLRKNFDMSTMYGMPMGGPR
jgi:hypothetical protein